MDQDFDTPKPSPEYPLKESRVLAMVEKYAPEDLEAFKNITEPGVSANPDVLEKWEAEQIAKRKPMRFSDESDFEHSARLLWEETFSVNQGPEKPFKGSNGITVGGLLSHFYDNSKFNGTQILDAPNWDLDGSNLKDILVNEKDRGIREAIFDWAERITYPQEYYYFRTQNSTYRYSVIKDPEKLKPREDVDTYGVRFLKLVKEIPELSEDLKDQELRNIYHIKDGINYPKLQFFRQLWSNLSSKTWDQETGRIKAENDTGVQEAFRLLVKIRTHPEFQFLYKYKSPSGYLNETSPQQELI